MNQTSFRGWTEAQALRERFDDEPSHSDQVTSLALQLFDALAEFHLAAICGGRERELLRIGALLHDIGWSQTPDGSGHHKESARLIHENRWSELIPEEVALVAQIARYHRKSIPQKKHEAFQALPARAQKQVMFLGGILRVADALDRTHQQIVAQVSITIRPHQLFLTVHPKRPNTCGPELAMVMEKKSMLELALERQLLAKLAD